LTAEQLEAARSERMRQNGHGAITIEDVRTWIEETGLCIFLPRSAQAGFTAPTFVEAVAGQRTTEPTLELIATAEALLVRLEAEGVAVRLNLSGQPGDQPDYVVAGWVLPYIYALRGDRDWRRSPQLTGSRQVSPLAVQAAKQIDTRNMNAAEIRDALGREVTETAVLRALHELWKQLRIIPVVPEVGTPALWQPLRQRFQKAIAEGASTSQVTAISVLASIYLQAVIAASMEDVELFLSPLTSRSKIREVVRGLAATRQVHSTQMGHSPMFYVAGTLPEFPAVPNFQISTTYSYRNANYRGANYLGTDPDQFHDDDLGGSVSSVSTQSVSVSVETRVVKTVEAVSASASDFSADEFPSDFPAIDEDGELTSAAVAPVHEARLDIRPAHTPQAAAKPAVAQRPRTARPSPARSGSARSSSARSSSAHSRDSRHSSDRRPAPAPRGNGSGARSGSGARGPVSARSNGFSKSNGNGAHANGNGAKPSGIKSNGANGTNGHHSNGNGAHAQNGASAKPTKSSWTAKPAGNGNGHSNNGNSHGVKSAAGTVGSSSKARPNARPAAGAGSRTASSGKPGFAKAGFAKPSFAKPGFKTGSQAASRTAKPAAKAPAARGTSAARPASRPATAKAAEREPAKASAAKRYSFSGSAKQAPKPAAKRPAAATTSRATTTARTSARTAAKPVAKSTVKSAVGSAVRSNGTSRTATAKRRG
jgi:23S rRNA pseudouridine2605 synthase